MPVDSSDESDATNARGGVAGRGACEREKVVVGSSVRAQYKALAGGRKWYSGKVTAVNKNGGFDIEYADGDCEEGVLLMHIKVLLQEPADVLTPTGTDYMLRERREKQRAGKVEEVSWKEKMRQRNRAILAEEEDDYEVGFGKKGGQGPISLISDEDEDINDFVVPDDVEESEDGIL